MHKQVFRLACLLALVALATSRIGLLGHELVGHGGAALAFGADILDVELFWFAGGWIRYQLDAPSTAAVIAIAMAGIALELVVGLGLWAGARGDSLGRRLVRGIGAALVVHATWYLATGAFHGFGDGLVLYRELGAARTPVAIAAGLATCMAAFFAVRGVLGALVATLPGSRKARVAGVLVAAALAGGLHAGLAAGELAIRRDATYTATMQTERDRVIAARLASWQREHAGADPGQERTRLERVHRTFPFVWLLAIATAAAALAGGFRARRYADERIGNRLLAIAAVVAGGAVATVIVLAAAV